MFYIIQQKSNNGIYLVEVKHSEIEYSYTWSVGATHYFERCKEESRLKVLKKMYLKKQLKEIAVKINEYSQGKLF